MKKFLVLLLLCSQNLWSIDANTLSVFEKSNMPQVVRAYYSNKQQVEELSKFIALWKVNTEQKYAVFEIENQQDFKQIIELGF